MRDNGGGGGIHNSGELTLTNSTVSGNSAPNGAGIASFGTAQLTNTIVANNPAGSDCRGPSVTSLGHNLDSDGTCGLNAAGDLPNTDPLLGPLQDNSGPTFTHALLPGSPAIDASDDTSAPATDQRGVPRSQGPQSDIGAYARADCAGSASTIVGTNGGETIVGTLRRDVIVAKGGGDTIRALGGNDIVCAGGGNDKVFGGKGRDRLFGGPGRDVLKGQGGNDNLIGQGGHDRLVGGGGNDKLFGNKGDDTLLGGAGNDTLDCGRGLDTGEGGVGVDTVMANCEPPPPTPTPTAPTVRLDYDPDRNVRDANTLTITATFSEAMNATPTIAIDTTGTDLAATDMTGGQGDTVWTYSYNVPARSDGAAVVTISGTDLAGNANDLATNATFTIDNTAPTVALTYNPDRDMSAGENLTITATFSQAINGTPTIEIDTRRTDQAATAMTDSGDQITWTFAYVVPAGSSGAAVVSIAGTDEAGNPNDAATNAVFQIV